MDQAIAVEWGRFLRDVEAQRGDALKENSDNQKSGPVAQAGRGRFDNSKKAILRRLEDALALPPPPEEPLCTEPAKPAPTPAATDPAQQITDAERSFLQQFARTPSAGEGSPRWLKTSPAEASSLLVPKHVAGQETKNAATGEGGTYTTRSQWNGVGFEEFRALITPPQNAAAAAELRPAGAREDAPVAEPLPETRPELPMPAAPEALMPVAPEAQLPAAFDSLVAAEPGETVVADPLWPARELELPAAFESAEAAEDVPLAEPLLKSASEPFLAAVPELPLPAAYEGDSAMTPFMETNENPEGEMWKSASQVEVGISEDAAFTGDAMQSAHAQDASRWFVLKGVLGGATAPEQTPDQAPEAEIPVLEVFSLAGGVGKTSLVATLGRALSARGERVLLVEATPFGSLPYFFGTCDCRPGTLRTFRPPASSTDAPIRLATVDVEASEAAGQGSLAADIAEWSRGVSRVIVDVATRSSATARELARMSPVVLAPLIPDVNSVVTANALDTFFQRQADSRGSSSDVYYVLNQFDPSLPLHLDVRKVLRDRLGERLLPFTLQRTPAISEALAEGMTIMDYAPESPAAADFITLAKWLENVLAPADMNLRGMRWSER